MRKEDFFEVLGELDVDIVKEAKTSMKENTDGKVRKSAWVKWGAVAACISVVLITGIFMLPSSNSVPTSIGGVPREYKETFMFEPEIDIAWPWEYMTISERYATVAYDKTRYTIKMMNQPLDSSFLGKPIGICDAIGYDPLTGQEYQENFGVRQITGISADLMIAVEMDKQFYVFKYDEYDPPVTLGDVLDGYSLSQTLTLDYFGIYNSGNESGYYCLSDDDYIWQILAKCRDAQFLEDDTWSPIDKDYIRYTVTSEPLGVYRRVFYVSADGYVNTNIFDWGYTFNIGEDAAKEIISYSQKSATEADREPYTYSLAGTLIEIEDDYIFVDDAILCAKKNDGMVFKIPTSDLRISRCLDYLNFEIGDFVVINFTGNVDVDAGNIVSGAVSMSAATIHEGMVLIPE